MSKCVNHIFGSCLLNHLMFADDLCVLCPSARSLQEILDICEAYAKVHGIVFNCKKCVAMTFRVKGMKHELVPSLSLCNSQLAVVGQVKYLGVVIDSLLCDDADILRQLRYQYCSANKLRASFFKCSISVKNVLFRSYCTALYAAHLWCIFKKSTLQRLRVAYNNGFRILYGLSRLDSARTHQVKRCIPTFDALLRKALYAFIRRCRLSSNRLMGALMRSDCFYQSTYFAYYRSVLFT